MCFSDGDHCRIFKQTTILKKEEKRGACPIHNRTLETVILSIMLKMLSFSGLTSFNSNDFSIVSEVNENKQIKKLHGYLTQMMVT